MERDDEEEESHPSLGSLIRIAEALDSLFDMTLPLGSLEAEDRVTIFNRTRALGIVAIDFMTEDQAATLEAILHPRFFDSREAIEATISARASLAVLRGYVHGCISELSFNAQLHANAQAYAAEKLKQERGMGFRSTSSPEAQPSK
jgi:hypothetical protein